MQQLVLKPTSALFQMEVFNAAALARLVLLTLVVAVEPMDALHILVWASVWKPIRII
jgi:hypothetical protein